MTIIYGDLKVITTNPADPILDEGYGRYMEPTKYEIYRLVFGKVHFVGVFSLLITFALYGFRCYIMKRSSS